MKTRRQLASKLPWALRRSVLRNLGTDPWRPENHTHRVVFVHIPRTGGTTIAKSILGGTFGHPYLDEFYAFDPVSTQKYFKFAMVRNPFDRLVSAYHQMQKNDINPLIKKIWRDLKVGSFEDLVERISGARGYSAVSKIVHFRTQYELIECPDVKIDFLGYFEKFDQSVKQLSKYTNKPMVTIHLNASKRKSNLREYYDDYSIDVVRHVFSKDFEAFGYPQDVPQ